MKPWTNLAFRCTTAELMDAPDVDPVQLNHALAHLETINRLLGGYRTSISGLRQLTHDHPETFSFLDVGCGSGDTLRAIAKWARKNNLSIQLTGIERCESTAERARQLCQEWPEIKIMHFDLFEIPPLPSFDVVHCALMLHHFGDDSDASRVLAQMSAISRHGIIVNDLHRHPLAYGSIWLLTRLFSRSHILQNDAPLSVTRAFTHSDLLRLAHDAGLNYVQIKWRWAFRWIMTARQIPTKSNEQ